MGDKQGLAEGLTGVMDLAEGEPRGEGYGLLQWGRFDRMGDGRGEMLGLTVWDGSCGIFEHEGMGELLH